MMKDEGILEKFSGELPLFPLPKVVLFPGARLPLHVFEPRYREMVADAEEGEGLIGIACLRERKDSLTAGDSSIYPTVCLGKMKNVQRLPDGRVLMQLVGIQRAFIREELNVDKPYRVARVELCPDVINPLEPEPVGHLFEQTLTGFNTMLRNLADLPGSLLSIQKDAPHGLLMDVLAYYLPVDSMIKQRLLEERDVHQRGRLLVRILNELSTVVPDDESVRFRIFPRPSWN